MQRGFIRAALAKPAAIAYPQPGTTPFPRGTGEGLLHAQRGDSCSMQCLERPRDCATTAFCITAQSSSCLARSTAFAQTQMVRSEAMNGSRKVIRTATSVHASASA